MDIEKYFKHIGYTGKTEPTLDVLREIHALHPQVIAFENLSSFLGEEVSLVPDEVYGKFIDKGRGGYCFEHNLVLATILKQLGFTVTEHAARVVWRSPDKTQMPRTHMLLRVMIEDEPWIADVGFGGLTMTAPLRLEPGLIQHSPHEDFMISREGEEYTISARLGDAWKAMYVFDLVPQYPVDFIMANHFVSTHPQSPFVHNLMLGRADADGRHALQNRHYTRYGLDGSRKETEITDVAALIDLLEDSFGLKLVDSIDIDKLGNDFEQLV